MSLSGLIPELKQKLFKDYLDWHSRCQLAFISKESYSFYSKIVVGETLTISSSHLENLDEKSVFFLPKSTCINLKVEFGKSPLTTRLFYKVITSFSILNTVALDYEVKLAEETLKGIANIIAKKANLVYISLPFNDFLLLSDLVSEKNCKTFCLGILENNNGSVTTRILLERESLSTMEKYQLKRPIDLIQPSPAVENSIKKLRNTLVLEELKNGNAYMVMEENQTKILSKPLLTIVDPNASYRHIKSPILQNITDGILPVNTQALERALKELGQAFIESIIVSGNNFVMITQFDVFLSNQPGLDDCAYPVQQHQDLASFHIELKQKTRFKTSWNELIIQNGQHQILATGGLFGTYGSNNIQPFLGSSFPFNFSDDGFTCYINEEHVLLKSQQRYLIDYKKMSANLLAGFISQRFSILGLEAVHPLHYTNAVPIGTQPQLSHIASRIICHYALNYCTLENTIDLLNLFLRTDTMTKLTKGKRQITKCSSLRFLLKKEISNQTRSIIHKLMKMEQITNKTSPARIATLDHEDESKRLRDLVNNGLSASIKKVNHAIVKKHSHFTQIG